MVVVVKEMEGKGEGSRNKEGRRDLHKKRKKKNEEFVTNIACRSNSASSSSGVSVFVFLGGLGSPVFGSKPISTIA